MTTKKQNKPTTTAQNSNESSEKKQLTPEQVKRRDAHRADALVAIEKSLAKAIKAANLKRREALTEAKAKCKPAAASDEDTARWMELKDQLRAIRNEMRELRKKMKGGISEKLQLMKLRSEADMERQSAVFAAYNAYNIAKDAILAGEHDDDPDLEPGAEYAPDPSQGGKLVKVSFG